MLEDPKSVKKWQPYILAAQLMYMLQELHGTGIRPWITLILYSYLNKTSSIKM